MGSTVNNIPHQFDCSRQTIHNLVNRYNITGSVRDRPTCDVFCNAFVKLEVTLFTDDCLTSLKVRSQYFLFPNAL